MSARQPADSQPDTPPRRRCVVSIVEDQAPTREVLVALVERAGWRARPFASAEEFVAAGPTQRPGCLVLDYQLPGINGMELQERLASEPDPLPIVITTAHADVPAAVRFMERGAITLLEKPCEPTQLVAAIDKAVRLDALQRRVRERFDEIDGAVSQLTAREVAVLQSVVTGKLNKAIARALDVSVRTIEGDRAKIVEKFGAQTTGEVVGKFAQYSLLAEMGYGAGGGPGFRPSVAAFGAV